MMHLTQIHIPVNHTTPIAVCLWLNSNLLNSEICILCFTNCTNFSTSTHPRIAGSGYIPKTLEMYSQIPHQLSTTLLINCCLTMTFTIYLINWSKSTFLRGKILVYFIFYHEPMLVKFTNGELLPSPCHFNTPTPIPSPSKPAN